ncbi:alpha/beta hydrolase [Virgisporangium ochraceum]|nr:alpha/beta fold hydrolase [Virgisporangium ochraceum]
MSVRTRPPAAVEVSPTVRGPRPWIGILCAATAAVGFLTGRDGTPGWQVVRVALTVAVAVAVGYIILRASAPVRGPATAAAGVVVTAVGAGTGLPHLAKVGWSAVTAAGVLALVCGTALLVGGAVVTVRAAHRWWRLPVALAVALVAVVSLWSGTVAVAATNVPRTAVGPTTPGERGLAYDDVTFPTTDGVRLSGWYLASTNRAAVVLLHGAGSTRSAVLDHAVVLARLGYGVLLFDARGHGRSGGRAMDLGWYGDRDVGAAVSYLRTRLDVDGARIGAVGLSMGGEEVLGAAATDPRIRAVVAEGATNRVAADKAFLSEAYGVRGRVQRGIDALTYAVTDALTAAHPPVTLRAAARAMAPRPVLLVTAGDVPDEGHAARYIQRGNPGVRIWEVPDSGHTRALRTHPDEWRQRVSAFLAAALGPPPA